jgi:para-nitrobenzyl esterase
MWWFAAQTELVFRVGTVRTADAVALHAPTFLYLFTHRSPAMGGWLGSCHCLELPFVFGAERVEGVTTWTGSGQKVDHLTTWVQQRWLAFARSGEPAGPNLDWPNHDPARRPTMMIDTECRIEDAPFDDELQAVSEVLPR